MPNRRDPLIDRCIMQLTHALDRCDDDQERARIEAALDALKVDDTEE